MIKRFKNLIVLALAITLTFASVAGVTGCSTHEHDISKWVTVTAATCTETGVEEGICATCGEVITREIPIDEENHVYGDWEIVTMPTETRRGTARKTCTLNSEHTLTFSLPVLGSEDYTTSITVRPTATTDGERTYVYSTQDEGDITFTTTISSTGIESVRDAVDVSCDSISHDAVRSGTGTVSSAYYSYGNEASSSSSYAYSYEYGTNYTHIDDTKSDNRERWYGVDEEGDIYGYCKYGSDEVYEETKTTAGSESYYYGYRYTFGIATTSGTVGTYYGTEALLTGLYTAARANSNNDFEEDSYSSNGSMIYSFSYGKFNNDPAVASTSYFSNIDVTFTLTSEYTIKSLTVKCTMYVNTEDTTTWKLDEDGYAYVSAPTGMRYVYGYSVTQVTKTEDPTEPENPYDSDSMRVSGFDVIYNNNISSSGAYVGDGTTITDSTIVNIKANEATQSSYSYTYIEYDSDGLNPQTITTEGTVNHFYLTNITPTNLQTTVANDLTAYYRVYSGSTYTDYEITAYTATDSLTSVGISFNYNSATNSFVLKSKIAGDVYIVLKTSKYEKVIHLYVDAVAPSTLYPMIYEYSASGYTWSSTYQSAVSESVYTNQGLYFKTQVPDLESRYASADYTATVTSAIANDGSTIDASNYSLEKDITFYSQTMSRFTAKVAGTYVITLVSTYNSSITTTITVTVSDAPDVSSLLSGTYTGRFTYTPRGTITVTFEAGEETGVYYATVTIGTTGTEILKCYYDGLTFTSEHFSGAADFGLTLTLNENYELELSHTINDDGDIEKETLLQSTT